MDALERKAKAAAAQRAFLYRAMPHNALFCVTRSRALDKDALRAHVATQQQRKKNCRAAPNLNIARGRAARIKRRSRAGLHCLAGRAVRHSS